jgi:hypothetical protein
MDHADHWASEMTASLHVANTMPHPRLAQGGMNIRMRFVTRGSSAC